jgi:hypothetical protein
VKRIKDLEEEAKKKSVRVKIWKEKKEIWKEKKGDMKKKGKSV